MDCLNISEGITEVPEDFMADMSAAEQWEYVRQWFAAYDERTRHIDKEHIYKKLQERERPRERSR